MYYPSRENKGADQLCGDRATDLRLCISICRTGGRTGLMVRASASGSGDPGSILGRVGVFVSLSKRHLLPQKVLVIPRNRWLRLNMTEKLFTGTLNHNKKKKKKKKHMQNVGFFTTRLKNAKFNGCKNDNFQLYYSYIFSSSSSFFKHRLRYTF